MSSNSQRPNSSMPSSMHPQANIAAMQKALLQNQGYKSTIVPYDEREDAGGSDIPYGPHDMVPKRTIINNKFCVPVGTIIHAYCATDQMKHEQTLKSDLYFYVDDVMEKIDVIDKNNQINNNGKWRIKLNVPSYPWMETFCNNVQVVEYYSLTNTLEVERYNLDHPADAEMDPKPPVWSHLPSGNITSTLKRPRPLTTAPKFTPFNKIKNKLKIFPRRGDIQMVDGITNIYDGNSWWEI